ncbi:MAG: hypothetical protein ACRD2I_23235 [Vicinamibacterales bacterium]
MTRRAGIELSPTACRIVELEVSPPWRRIRASRVRSFAVLPPSGAETQAKLETLCRRPAAVVVWGGRTEHRQVMVTAGSYESMRAEALAALSAAGLQTSGVWADIAMAPSADQRAARRPVVVSMASASDMVDALLPLREAGIQLRTVTTPAVVLGSLARLRQSTPGPDVIESYVALDETATCITLVRRGVLLAARDLPWGFVDADYSRSELRSRQDIAVRLADAIEEFVTAVGGSTADIGQVSVCGGVPELRSMSTLLMEHLDVEVEPLDGLFGIDAARLPAPADEFRERSAALRLAWAAAADWPPVINLLRARRRQMSRTWLSRAAVLAGAAVGVTGSWLVVDRGHLWLAAPTTRRIASGAAVRGRAGAPAPPSTSLAPGSATLNRTRVVPAAPVLTTSAPAAGLSPAVVNKAPATPPVAATRSLAAPPSAMNAAPTVTARPAEVAKAPVAMPPPARAARSPIVAPRAELVVPRPAVAAKPAPVEAKPSTGRATKRVPALPLRVAAENPAVSKTRPIAPQKPAKTTAPVALSEAATAKVEPAPAQEAALPFDAVLGTILYSVDRQLAIVDNRIVGVGDEVRGARIVAITAGAVTLRDTQGRLRRLTLGATSR